MNAYQVPLIGWAAMAVMMAALFVVHLRRRQADIVDVGWAFGLGVLAIMYAVLLDGNPARRMLVAVLGAVWSFRLAGYLFTSRFLAPEEDGRYAALREEWKTNLAPKFFAFFQAQGFLDVVLSASFFVAAMNPSPLGAWDAVACVIWLVSVGGEAVADAQLSRFRSNPGNRGKVCRVGLWRYSRHPNYFFEWLHWWAYVALAVGAPLFWLTLLSPALMLLFILKITGIPPTEARALVTRGDAYRAYQRTTSAFVPWIPKEES